MNNAKPSPAPPAIFSIYFGHKPTDRINCPFSASSPSNWWPSFCSLGSASADQANSVDPREWESLQISINYSPSPRYILNYTTRIIYFATASETNIWSAWLCPRLVSEEFLAADLFGQASRRRRMAWTDLNTFRGGDEGN